MAHPRRTRSASLPTRKLELRQRLLFPRGGARKGAGRKRKAPRPRVSHETRPALARRFPVVVTWRLRAGLPNLRRPETRAVLHERLRAGSDRFGFRLVHFSIQSNHLHMLAEAQDERSLGRGLQGLGVRIAKGLNKHWGRKGRVFDDRYHARILRTPLEVRNALVYVIANVHKHDGHTRGIDSYSSGAWFQDWREVIHRQLPEMVRRPPPCVDPCVWLLRIGWKRHGEISVDEVPARKA